MDRVSWTTPKADDKTDQRVVINPGQAVGLLKAVEDMDLAMVGFLACVYYAALRPGEVVYLRKENCALPENGCGKRLLSGSTQYMGAWGANGQAREDRALKPHLAHLYGTGVAGCQANGDCPNVRTAFESKDKTLATGLGIVLIIVLPHRHVLGRAARRP